MTSARLLEFFCCDPYSENFCLMLTQSMVEKLIDATSEIIQLPLDWNITHSDNHWSNELTMLGRVSS